MEVMMKVLVVEDSKTMQIYIRDTFFHYFGPETEVLIAKNLSEANIAFTEHSSSLDLILMDLSLGLGEYTFDLIRNISLVYKGPIVAMSAMVNNHKEMIQCGCTHACDKIEILNFIINRRFENFYQKK